MASSGLRKMLYLPKLVNAIDDSGVVYDVEYGVHTDDMADIRGLCAAADVTQNL